MATPHRMVLASRRHYLAARQHGNTRGLYGDTRKKVAMGNQDVPLFPCKFNRRNQPARQDDTPTWDGWVCVVRTQMPKGVKKESKQHVPSTATASSAISHMPKQGNPTGR